VLPDYLAEGLKVVFTGTSVATASAARGHYYSGPGNRFWELLWEAGLTGNRILTPEQDAMVLRYDVGLTDLVKTTAASSDSLLRPGDFDVPLFVAKIEAHRPVAVAFNGREAAKRVARFLREPEPGLGPASWRVGESRVYVLPSSSGSSADPRHFAPKSSKADWWRELGRSVAFGASS
jgi:TDG/mug DNA glycosylase family protein